MLFRSELTVPQLPTGRAVDANKTETIILVRPRLVQIRPGQAKDHGSLMRVHAGVQRAPNQMGDVISDEARMKRILEELKLQ